jgi:hypothetical protein
MAQLLRMLEVSELQVLVVLASFCYCPHKTEGSMGQELFIHS